MQTPPEGMQLCPTRTDGEPALIAHAITLGECQKRQREHFHKCPTCVHYNARAESTPSGSLPLRGDVEAAARPSGS